MKRTLLTLTFSLLSVVIFAQVSAKEKQALLDLYLATNGENWINTWDINEPVANWKGITIENNKVVGISLLFNNMEGILPATLGNLEALKVLELSFNKISGTLPESLGNLQSLEVMAFNGNDLNGTIPATLANLYNLKQLHLSSNKLNGTIPAPIGYLEKLEVFNVFDNNLNGELPIGLASNANLKELVVAENNLRTDENFSKTLLSNSGAGINLNKPILSPSAKNVIAIETSDDEN